jgi:hypothetical protein
VSTRWCVIWEAGLVEVKEMEFGSTGVLAEGLGHAADTDGSGLLAHRRGAAKTPAGRSQFPDHSGFDSVCWSGALYEDAAEGLGVFLDDEDGPGGKSVAEGVAGGVGFSLGCGRSKGAASGTDAVFGHRYLVSG